MESAQSLAEITSGSYQNLVAIETVSDSEHAPQNTFRCLCSILSSCEGEKIERQGHEKGQSKDRYVKCDIADKVLDWNLGKPGTIPNSVPLWPEANYYTSIKDKNF